MEPSLIAVVLLFLLQMMCACAKSQDSISLQNPATQRGLQCAIFTFGVFDFLATHMFILPLHLAGLDSAWIFWILFGMIVADLIVIVLLESYSSRHRMEWIDPFSKIIAGFFAFLLSWIPLNTFPESEMNALEAAWRARMEKEPADIERSAALLENVLDLKDTTLDEICTHRSDVVSLSLQQTPEDWRKIILENRHTFYPVTNENEEDVIGVLDTRDYFRLNDYSRRSILKNTMESPFFVAENTRANDLLQQMKQRKNYFAIVLDEYGGVTGIATLQDVLEEVIGDIHEAEDENVPEEIVILPKGGWRISGSAALSDVSKALKEDLKLDDYETFSGFILGTIQRIPEDGTQFEVQIGDLDIQVRQVENHRIRQTLVHKISSEAKKEDTKANEEHNVKNSSSKSSSR